jgi:hypothetical protein
MTKAERRHRMERAKARAARLFWVRAWLNTSHENRRTDEQIIGMAARTRKPCSDWCCGNPRRHFKHALTVQELRAG